MKILYVDQTGQLGGGELAILPWLCAHSHDARVVLFKDGPFKGLVEDCGIPVDVLEIDSVGEVRRESGIAAILSALPSFFSLRRRLARLAAGFEMLYANSQKAFVVAALSNPRGVPLVWHLRDILTADHFSPILRRVAVFFGNRCATLIIVNSQATADSFVAAGGLGSKVRVVHDGISPAPFDDVATDTIENLKREIGAGGKPIVGIFGRLSPWKGQHILLDALSGIPNAHVVLVGDALFGEDEYVEQLKARASQADIAGRVHFLGFRRDIPALMKSMDIIVHASTSPEPFGLVIVEAMLATKPIIATRAGGAMEIVANGESGILVSPGSVPEMRAALEGLLADSGYLARLASTGRRRAESVFSVEAMFHGISSAINEAQRGDSK